jgi:phosphorylase kinase alpha/beta subunit
VDTLSQSTAGEQSFKLHVNHLLNNIQAPAYRQLTVEALKAIASIFRANALLHIDDTLFTDTIINHAVRINWLQSHPRSEKNYQVSESLAWQAFYFVPPHKVANGILDALLHLLDNNKRG